jgi:carboxypeptidase C (cathepsin A)
MLHVLRPTILALLAIAAITPLVAAQDQPQRRDRAEPTARDELSAEAQGVLRLLPSDATSEKTIDIGGRTLTYTATAGTLPLYNQSGEHTAAVFYTAYVAKGANTANRPVTFAFNGGPGAASAYLHLGLAGPRIVQFGPDGRDGATVKLVDNPDTWLAFTDLVMIDPIGTGWSRTVKPDDRSFWSVGSDAESLAKAIALYVSRNSRTSSPKFILGESYGGFRAAKVARALQTTQGIIAAGIVMVSPMIEASYTFGARNDALSAALQFPSLVATELERTGNFTPEAMAEAERFAITEYLSTLAGARPTGGNAKAFYDRIARMTGLEAEEVAKTRGYVRDAYMTHLRSQGVLVSDYDADFVVPNPFPGWRPSGDLVLDGFTRALAGTFAGYARDELGFKTDMTYLLLNRDLRWDWGGTGARRRVGVSDDLRWLLALNPSFRLLVAHGRSDLVTSYGVSRYLLHQLTPVDTPDRVQFRAYRGGHMFYFSQGLRRAFSADARDFYQAAP